MVEYLNKHFRRLFSEPRRTAEKSVRKKILEGIREDMQTSGGTCSEVVTTIIRYHGGCRHMCYSGHPILQIALRLCFLDSVQDSSLVSDLLREVYSCEGTFEKLFAGAVFGINASYLACGWKSDFSTAEENIEAVSYFLMHSNRSKCLFGRQRLQEVPMKNSGLPPLVPALQLRNNEMFTLLMRYGASFAESKQNFKGLRDLKLLCKKKILFLLWRNWELPTGIPKLPLPGTLIDYLEYVDPDSEKLLERGA